MEKTRQESLACLLHEVSHMMGEMKGRALKKFGISFPQMMVIGFLHENRGKNVNQKMICERMRIKGSSATSLIDNMEKNGLIERRVDPSDGRGNVLSLTEKGEESAKQITDILTEIDDNAMSVLTEEEKQVMKGLLLKLLEK